MRSLHDAVEKYVCVKRSLGLKYDWCHVALRDFASFLRKNRATHVTTEMALRWAMLPANARPSHWHNRLGMVRGFARHLCAQDPRTEVPPLGLIAPGPRRREPHVYTDAQIRQLVRAARALPSRRGCRPGFRGWWCSTMIGLLAATGMRIGEVCALERRDVDLARGLLTIRRGKFGVTRLIPIHATTRSALRAYARERDRRHPRLETSSFFVCDRGRPITDESLRHPFDQLTAQAGLRATGCRPRIHDLRHTFAVRTLLRWYREGHDVERQLPVLSTYLGHVRSGSTYWYFSAIPELMSLVGRRLERRLEG